MTGLAKRMAEELADRPRRGWGWFSDTQRDLGVECAAEAVRRTIALAAGVVGEMAGKGDDLNSNPFIYARVLALREAERKIKELLGGEEDVRSIALDAYRAGKKT